MCQHDVGVAGSVTLICVWAVPLRPSVAVAVTSSRLIPVVGNTRVSVRPLVVTVSSSESVLLSICQRNELIDSPAGDTSAVNVIAVQRVVGVEALTVTLIGVRGTILTLTDVDVVSPLASVARSVATYEPVF